jgi:hypothetical protein
VPYFRWGLLKSLDDKKKYLYQLLQVGGGGGVLQGPVH